MTQVRGLAGLKHHAKPRNGAPDYFRFFGSMGKRKVKRRKDDHTLIFLKKIYYFLMFLIFLNVMTLTLNFKKLKNIIIIHFHITIILKNKHYYVFKYSGIL